MSTVKVTIEIDAPVEHVWETIMNPALLEDWVTIHRSVGGVSEDPTTQGATMDQVLCMRGVSFKVHWRLASVDAPHRAEWEGRGPAHSLARIVYQLAGVANGRTRFDYTNEFKAPGGILGNVASRVVVGAISEREARGSLQRLKQLLERT
ncbi:MAG: SRPBCC family protein [Solirubrobacteraceae bacterium]